MQGQRYSRATDKYDTTSPGLFWYAIIDITGQVVFESHFWSHALAHAFNHGTLVQAHR